MSTTLISKIRKKFCHPIAIGASKYECGKNEYCVLGALNRTIHSKDSAGFPKLGWGAILLRKANKQLTLDVAETFARKIIKDNDSRRFSAAWKLLDKALRYKEAKKAQKAKAKQWATTKEWAKMLASSKK